MKRLIRICLNSAIFSLIPILSWFMLGITVDKNLVNVFTLTYPLQFVWTLLKSIFGTGANIYNQKEENDEAVLSGMTVGIIAGFIIFGIFIINIKQYIEFMNMDYKIYKEFAIYSIIQLYIQLIFSFVLEKLYFAGKEKIANKYCIQFNVLNFSILLLTALILKDKIKIIIVTLICISLYTLIVVIRQYKKFKLKIQILKYMKYESVEICNNILFFLIFLLGLSNALEFGERYLIALNFVALISDTQWDSFEAITTVAKIDISKNCFNYKKHKENAYKLLVILLLTIFIMFIITFKFYNSDLKLTIIYLGFEIVNFSIYPIYKIKTCYLQLEQYALKVTTNKMFAGILRLFISFLKTPFCTGVGQLISSFYQFITVNIIFHNNFEVNKEGNITKKQKI